MVTTETKNAERIKVDPLRVLSLPEVCSRTGYGRTKILEWLAKDEMDKRPGRLFPVPMKRPTTAGGLARMEWRELRIVEWMEAREDMEARKVAR